ncbi:MAG TPA: hypothetical protein VFS67_23580 [Polyangiaceae bacterium]|nr:hypothetical protein [Polyangiaceae bacterium]
MTARRAAPALWICTLWLVLGCECGSERRPSSSFSASAPAAISAEAPAAGRELTERARAAALAVDAGARSVARREPPPPEREPVVVSSSTGGRDATSDAGSVVGGLVFDSLVEIAPAGPATATEHGVAMINRENELWLAQLEHTGKGGARPRVTPLQILPDRAAPFPLAKGPAVRGGYAYWVSHGRLLRHALAGAGPGAVPEVLRDDARVGTRVAVPVGDPKLLRGVPPLAAYVARAAGPDEPLRAKLWVEGQPDAWVLTDDLSSAHSVQLLGTPQGVVAIYLEARTGMSSLHLRRLEISPQRQVTLSDDRVVWVGGPSRSTTEFLAQSADGSSLLGLMALERDITHFGLLTLRVPLAGASAQTEPDWLLYENGIEPAPFAGAELCGRRWVALARPSTAEPHAPQELVLIDLQRQEAPAIVLARSGAFFDVSLWSAGDAGLLAYVGGQRTWGRSLRCGPS